MSLGNEREAVQKAFTRYAVEAGWTYLLPEDALRLRNGGATSPLLDSVFIEQLQRLNPDVVDYRRAADVANRLKRVHPSIEGSLDAWEYLKGLKTVFVQEQKRERNVRLLNHFGVEANKFHVTTEFTFSNGVPPNIRADIVLFVNGVPVVVVETKPATARDGISQALGDVQHYHRKAPEFLAISQLFALTQLIEFYYGATWNTSPKALVNWRDEQAGDFETLCKSFVSPRRMLRALTDFILFTRQDGELSKVVLRPHQMRAVERCLERAQDSQKRHGLVWHTQGSGKTYTMIVTAKLLHEDPAFGNPTVLMIVDRNELETQLFGNLQSAGLGHVEVASSRGHLRRLLEKDQRGLIISTIHKFDDMPANMSGRSNILVLVDEAHRTTGGDLGNYLEGALPNATFLGFTGTPIDKTARGRGTFKVFGRDDEKGYLDKYSIRESIQDGATVPLHYALAPNELRVDRETLNKAFLDLAEAEGVSDIDELNTILERAVTLRNMMKETGRIEKIAAYVAKHFSETVEPMGYKAFLVGVDREACCLYKEALDRYLPPEYSKVVMSQALKRDPDHMKAHYLSDDEEEAARKAFRKPDLLPKILIVTEKLLTGFDAPVLYCMYLDKPMRDHVLLQAIARVNRPYADDGDRPKPCGFVLDFVGIFENLGKALAFDSQDVSGVIEGIDVLQGEFAKHMETARGEHLSVIQGRTGDKEVEAVLEHLRDREPRERFYTLFKDLQEMYEILSPDPFLRPFLEDYQRLSGMFFVLKACYDRAKLDQGLQHKTAALVQSYLWSGDIQTATEQQSITPDLLDAIAGGDRPGTVRVFNLVRVFQALVNQQSTVQPYLISIGERAQRIAEAFEERQSTAQEALQSLVALIADLRQAQEDIQSTGLSEKAFTVYYVLKEEEIADPLELAEDMEAVFNRHPHWEISEREEGEVRREMYKVLQGAGLKPELAVETGAKMLDLVRRKVS